MIHYMEPQKLLVILFLGILILAKKLTTQPQKVFGATMVRV